MDLEKLKLAFDKYVSNYDMSIKEISLKYYHSYKVMNLMEELAIKLDLDDEEIKLAKVIGLLHDIGRFEQFNKYQTLRDSDSSDHADESCVYLFDEGHIRDFIDDDKYDELIRLAIKNHNKKNIDENIKDLKILKFCKMIRDMDKVDIYRVYATYFDYTFDANEVSVEVLEEFNHEKSINTLLKKSKSDAIIIILAFIFDINFNESFDILVETDNFDYFLSTINVSRDSEKLWKKLREICFSKINKGVI